jgi:hypothetical protein
LVFKLPAVAKNEVGGFNGATVIYKLRTISRVSWRYPFNAAAAATAGSSLNHHPTLKTCSLWQQRPQSSFLKHRPQPLWPLCTRLLLFTSPCVGWAVCRRCLQCVDERLPQATTSSAADIEGGGLSRLGEGALAGQTPRQGGWSSPTTDDRRGKSHF